MRIAMIGTRGIPNQYGGFEQFAEFAAPELVNRGHDVTVYNSSMHPNQDDTWKGVHLVRKFDPENKIGTAGQFVYDLNCILDARKRGFDVILQLGYTSSSVWSFLFPKKTLVVTNMDGMEWSRAKYSKNVQRFLRRAEKWAALKSDYLIADSKCMKEYLKKKYDRDSLFIAYGAQLITVPDEEVLAERRIEKYGYNLLIARMEPENNIETVIRAHEMSRQAKPLLIVGNHDNYYGSFLKKKYGSDNIRFLGPIFDLDLLNGLRYFACYYFHGHSSGGTNPSLLEAMASYSLIIAHDNIFNKSVLENDAFYFTTAEDISSLLKAGINREDCRSMIQNNAARIRDQYCWEQIINSLENYLVYGLETSAKNRD